jgi:PPP family 3-phenylpropionic acid transporter
MGRRVRTGTACAERMERRPRQHRGGASCVPSGRERRYTDLARGHDEERGLGASLRFGGLYAAAFVGLGIYLPFFPVWLQSRGLGPEAIGAILSIPIVVRIVATAPLTAMADRAFGPRRLLLASYALSIATNAALFGATNPVTIALLLGLAAFSQAPVIPTTDFVAGDAIRRDRRLDYGRIRLWGSIAFLAANVAGGYALADVAPDVIIVLLAVLPLAGIAATLFAVPASAAGPPTGSATMDASPARVPRQLWFFIAAAACSHASHAGLYGFATLSWRAQGFSDPMIGWLWATGVVAEILLFGVLGRTVGGSSSAVHLLRVGAAAVVVRFAALGFEPGLATTFALQALHGLTFGATHLAAMAAIVAMAPEGARGRIQGTVSALVALASALATLGSGVVFRAAGPMVFLALAPLGAAALILSLFAASPRAAQPQSAGEGG